MKRVFGAFALIVFLAFLNIPSHAQSQDIEQLALDIEKLTQFKKILQDLYDGYKVLEEGYNKVRDVATGNFNLHQAFLDGLLAVNPAVKQYSRVGDIISDQLALVAEYKSAFKIFRSCNQFNPNEIDYLSRVYSDLTGESAENLNALLQVISSGDLRMNDEERLQAIDRIYHEMESKLSFLRDFDTRTHILALQRLKEKSELEGLKGVYDVK